MYMYMQCTSYNMMSIPPNSNKPGSNGFHFSILSLDSHILKIVFHFKRQIENHSGKQLTCILIQIERGVLLMKM